jgi:DMSO/TMAO reductase YedYZ molybdopterin-dependent catalytic subunit
MHRREGDVIVSSDMDRDQRIPPGQTRTEKWPVLHYGEVPDYGDLSKWDFRIYGLVERPLRVDWKTFAEMPRATVRSDIHCVTTWSRLDNLWRGPSTRSLMERVGVKPEAAFVIAHCEFGFTANVPMDHFADDDALVALTHDGQPLTPEHGYPARLLIPKLYFWKSAKWLRALEFVSQDRAGFWEMNGYHMRGDPWTEERYW